MKRVVLIILLIFTLVSCGSAKKTQRALNTGNYDTAISIALDKLKTYKYKKRKQEYVVMLEEAYKKAVTRDIERISFLQQEKKPANSEEIYHLYNGLRERQESIKPILPLRIIEENRDAVFIFENYNSEIILVKNAFTEYLYGKGNSLIETASNKLDYRKAYEELIYLNKINPGYLNTKQLIEKAYKHGLDYILVHVENNTEIVIPRRLEKDLLNFSTYGLNDIWVVYHSTQLTNQTYDYELNIDFRAIKISPEQVKERQFIKEKEIVDGWEYLLDENDDQVRNEKGEKIKIDKLRKVRFEYFEFTQFKSVEVAGNVSYTDLQTKQLLDNFPLKSEYVFSHIYATGSGDRRALEKNISSYLDLKNIPFPTNEQMIYDSGQDLKNNLKSILTGYQFRE